MTGAAFLGVTFEFLTNGDFWINVGVLATTYGVFALGIQLNIGTTGIFNFGQAGFMAVGSYTMGILVVKSGVLVLARDPCRDRDCRSRRDPRRAPLAPAAGRLLRDLDARLQRDRPVHRGQLGRPDRGNLGLFGYTNAWTGLSARIDGWLGHLGIAPRFLLPLLLVNLTVFLVLAAFVAVLVRSPWGRVLNAIREDEDAARALGKNTFAYKLQSLSISAALAAIAGYMLAINISILSPTNFDR